MIVRPWALGLIIPVLLALPLTRAWAAPAPAGPPPIQAAAAIVVDASTGTTLWSRNADAPRPMASVTKLMTLLLAVQAIRLGRVHWHDRVPVSLAAYRTGGSQIWLEPGERLTLRQMLTALAVGSANDAAVAVAEFLSGSTANFVVEMNREAARLGMRGTHFANPHGLPDLAHYSTARDLALLGLAAVRHPALLRLTAQREDRTLRNGRGGTLWLINQNRMLRTFPGTDGLKTGYTRAAGFCLVVTALRGHTRLLAVILGAPTSRQRFVDATALLNWGFSNFRTRLAVSADKILGRVAVRRGRSAWVSAVALHPLYLTVRRDVSTPLTTEIALRPVVAAPVRRGQVLGWVTVAMNGKPVGRVPLIARSGIAAVSWPDLAWRYFWRLVA